MRRAYTHTHTHTHEVGTVCLVREEATFDSQESLLSRVESVTFYGRND